MERKQKEREGRNLQERNGKEFVGEKVLFYQGFIWRTNAARGHGMAKLAWFPHAKNNILLNLALYRHDICFEVIW